MGRLVGEYLADRVGTVGATQGLTAGAIGESLGKFGKDLQMLLRCLFGDKQYEKEGYRLAIRGVKRYRRSQTQKCAAGFLQPFDAAMGNRYALSLIHI